MGMILGPGIDLQSDPAAQQSSCFERRLMLERTRPSDSSAPSLRELFFEQQRQLERTTAATSASIAASTEPAALNTKTKGTASSPLHLRQRLGLPFRKSSPSGSNPPSQYRYVKARDATALGTSSSEVYRTSSPSPALLSGSVPLTPPTSASAFPISNSPASASSSSQDTSPMSLASSASRTDPVHTPAMPIAVFKAPLPHKEQSVFEWSPENSPKHLRSYMNEFLGGGAGSAHNRAPARARPLSNSAQPRNRPVANGRNEDAITARNIVKGRNRKGSVSAFFHPDNLPSEFIDATREMEVVARRNRRLSSADTTAAGSDLESNWIPSKHALKIVPPTLTRTRVAPPTSEGSIPLPIFGQASLRELRRRTAMHKPDGLKLLINNKPNPTSVQTTMTPSSSCSSSDLVPEEGSMRPAGFRSLSPTVPTRGGSLYLTKGRQSKSRSPISSPKREKRNPFVELETSYPPVPVVEKALLFSSLEQEAGTGQRESVPRFSRFLDLSAEIMDSLGSIQTAPAQTTRRRSDTVNTVASNYSDYSEPTRIKKNSIIALPTSLTLPSSPKEPPAFVPSSSRQRTTATRPRRGSVLQRLKYEDAQSTRRMRAGSIPSVYSMESAEEVNEEEEEEEGEEDANANALLTFSACSSAEVTPMWEKTEDQGSLFTPLPLSPCSELTPWSGTTLPGRRLSYCPTPIIDGPYRTGLLHSRPTSLSLSNTTNTNRSTPSTTGLVWNWESDVTGTGNQSGQGENGDSELRRLSEMTSGSGTSSSTWTTSSTSTLFTPQTPYSTLLLTSPPPPPPPPPSSSTTTPSTSRREGDKK